MNFDDLWTNVNTVVCCLMSLGTGWACLSQRVRDGMVIKVGLILLSVGFATHAFFTFDGIDRYDAIALTRAQLLINAGMVIVVMGWVWRGRGTKVHTPERRASDFVDLDVVRSERQP
jgi:hypothetical protein